MSCAGGGERPASQPASSIRSVASSSMLCSPARSLRPAKGPVPVGWVDDPRKRGHGDGRNEATQTDWMGDLSGGLGVGAAAGRGRCSAASGRAGSGSHQDVLVEPVPFIWGRQPGPEINDCWLTIYPGGYGVDILIRPPIDHTGPACPWPALQPCGAVHETSTIPRTARSWRFVIGRAVVDRSACAVPRGREAPDIPGRVTILKMMYGTASPQVRRLINSARRARIRTPEDGLGTALAVFKILSELPVDLQRFGGQAPHIQTAARAGRVTVVVRRCCPLAAGLRSRPGCSISIHVGSHCGWSVRASTCRGADDTGVASVDGRDLVAPRHSATPTTDASTAPRAGLCTG